MSAIMPSRDQVNGFRFEGGTRGHYESYFTRANHPERALAFWIRYTMFAPRGTSEGAVGELWAVYFDGEKRKITALKEVLPFARCRFARHGLDVRVGESTLDDRALSGAATMGDQRIAWSLAYRASESPLLLLPERLYRTPFPKAKALVGSPLAHFDGTLEINGQRIEVSDWVGSQNHNWGEKHTDRYAWGQVAGFDDAPDAFFECATARIKLGPVLTPPMTPMVLRYQGEEYRLSSLVQTLRATGKYDYFTWELASHARHVSIEATFRAQREDFVALRYPNPPGGDKTCLNSKLAGCELVLKVSGKKPVIMRTTRRAAFEILTDDQGHGVTRLEA
jgi:hypothetical protein